MIKFTIAILAAGANAVDFPDCEFEYEECSDLYFREDCFNSSSSDGWWYVTYDSDDEWFVTEYEFRRWQICDEEANGDPCYIDE